MRREQPPFNKLSELDTVTCRQKSTNKYEALLPASASETIENTVKDVLKQTNGMLWREQINNMISYTVCIPPEHTQSPQTSPQT